VIKKAQQGGGLDPSLAVVGGGGKVVYPFVCMEQLGSRRKDFLEI